MNTIIDNIINQMIAYYAPEAQGYHKDKAVSMMYNTVVRAKCTTYEQIEDIVRGMCHVFSYGIGMGEIIQERKDKCGD